MKREIIIIASVSFMLALFSTNLQSKTSILLTVSFISCLLYFDAVFNYYIKPLLKK